MELVPLALSGIRPKQLYLTENQTHETNELVSVILSGMVPF